MRDFSTYTAGKKLLFGILLFLSALFPQSTKAVGLTIITHGYDGDVTGWITAMADEIPTYFQYGYPGLSTNFTIYTITLTYSNNTGDFYYQWERDSDSSPSSTDTGEIIVKLDWSQLSGGLDPDELYDFSTSNVAWVASYVLLQTNTISDLNGHALVEYPIHLIGHSRGGSLMNQLSQILGTNGVWVDHLTTLDPHPLNNDVFDDFPLTVVDASASNTYVNVLFADNYYQRLGNGDLDPIGEPVAGAYQRELYSLDGGYINDPLDIFNDPYQFHSNVHLWYYGTIDWSTPATYDDDGETVTIDESMRENWWVNYEQEGTNAGFEYTLIGGGNRMSTDEPLGAGFPAIVDGYNQWWDFGAGNSANRTVLPSNNGTWPSLIQFNVVGTNIVTTGQTIATKFYYQYGGTSSSVTAQFYFDSDFNPYNSNSTSIAEISLPNSGINSVYYDSLNLTTTNVPPGFYAIYGKISDGTHTRYLYTPEVIEILPSQLPPVLAAIKLNGSQLVIAVSGISGQTIVLQSSPDLHNWLPFATNTLTSGTWNYTNTAPQNMRAEFYRAFLMP